MYSKTPILTSGMEVNSDDTAISPLSINAHYYQQFASGDADPPVAASLGGWRSSPIELSPERTALVVMHAWDCQGVRRRYPGWYRCAESLDRMAHITREVLGPLVEVARSTGTTIYHVAYPGSYYQHLPGYQRAEQLVSKSPSIPQIPTDLSLESLRKFRSDHVFVGAENVADVACAFERLDFAPAIQPRDHESIVDTSAQLFGLCTEDGMNHLIYTGFTVNGCLMMMPGGMEDMRRHGLLCSVIREATTAIENHETIATERAKAMALWQVSLLYGFVFDQQDVQVWMQKNALGKIHTESGHEEGVGSG